MKQLLKKWFRSFETLDDRIFLLTVLVAIFTGFIVYIADILEGLSLASQLAVLGIIAIMILLLWIGVYHPSKRPILRLCLVLALNFVMFPASFYFSGGVYSGMMLFFLVGLFLVPVLLRGKTGVALFVLSLLFMLIVIDSARYFPQFVTPMTVDQHYQDVKVTLLISGVGLASITMLMLRAYNEERVRNQKLVDSLRTLSVKDPLSGLFNRRELFRRLDIMYSPEPVPDRRNTLVPEGHYIAMFDIDNFKQINDNYGHAAGDVVVREVSLCLNQMVHPQDGELAARYGGEEFVCVLAGDSLDSALERVNAVRKQISEIRWKDDQPPHVTISGGMVSCMEYDSLSETMRHADELLYHAKHTGKNRICTAADGALKNPAPSQLLR